MGGGRGGDKCRKLQHSHFKNTPINRKVINHQLPTIVSPFQIRFCQLQFLSIILGSSHAVHWESSVSFFGNTKTQKKGHELKCEHSVAKSPSKNTVKPVLSGPLIKRIPCIKRTPASVKTNFYSLIFYKMNLH